MKYKVSLFSFLFILTLSSAISSGQELVKICERGVIIYQNSTSCPDAIYVERIETKEENVQTLSTIIATLLIICIAGIGLTLYKVFLKK